MKIILGPFHPQLEDAFVEAIQDFKSSDPLKPLLILVPSDALRRYLMRKLTLKHGLSLINVSLLNFNQLSNTLYEEAHPAADLKLKDDLFFEEILHLLLQEAGSDFSELKASEGGVSALWQSLRDLKEGLLDPDIAIQALKEGHFGKTAMRGRLPRLFNLYRQLRQICAKEEIFDYGEIAGQAKDSVADSAFLKSFPAIFYYGFYDLTQVLVDLLHEVTTYHPTTLFFPLIRSAPAWVFSERFFERHVEGMTSAKSVITDLTKNDHPTRIFSERALFSEDRIDALPSLQQKACRVISCYDTHDEVLTVAKEMLRLNRDEGLAFHEIGIVAQNMDAYLSPIQDLFQKHAIPIASTCETALIRYPLAKSVFLMTGLLAQDFPRGPCIDLMSSPFFKMRHFVKNEVTPKSYQWDVLSRKAKITKGWDAWKKLDVLVEKDPKNAAQAALLLSIFSSLYHDLNTLPSVAEWSDYAALWRVFLEKYLGLAPRDEKQEETIETPSDTECIAELISKILTRLAALGKFSGQVTRDDFIAAFQRGLKRATLPFATHNILGTSVMNIMQARGLSFRILFVLGVNEGSFPRTIREDPFLKDRHRRVLETVLGYKVGEKLAAYDEEKLLFTLTVASAVDQCYVLYHRTDGLGGQSAPSWYVGELKRVFQIADESETFIPHGLMERHFISPFDKAEGLLPSEWAIRLCLSGVYLDPLLINQLPFSSGLYRRVLRALGPLEDDGPLSAHDGFIAETSVHWQDLLEKGVSPTRLETYARCPFQYYGKHLLKLSTKEDFEDEVVPKTNDIGTLCHEILKVFYEELYSEDQSSAVLKNSTIVEDLASLAEPFFETYLSENPVAYPLHWQILKITILAMLSEVIEKDIAALSESGYRPAAFEVECRQQIEAEWPEFRGKIDRVDFNAEEGKARVVDYKITFRKKPLPLEKNLMTSALRGKKLQAPIYLRLAEIFAEARAGSESGQTESVFYHLAPNWPDGPLVISKFPELGWQGECGEMLKRTISFLLQGIEKGRFFMKPGNHCDFCEIRTLCRLNHSPSLKRLQGDALWQEQEMLQKLKPPKSTSKKKKDLKT